MLTFLSCKIYIFKIEQYHFIQQKWQCGNYLQVKMIQSTTTQRKTLQFNYPRVSYKAMKLKIIL